MSREQFGVSRDQQLEISEQAVIGAIDDVLPEAASMGWAVPDMLSRQIDRAVERIAETRGVSIDEARVIYTQELLVEFNGGE